MYSLGLHAGYVDNAATIDGQDNYSELEMGSEVEYTAAFTMVLSPVLDVELALSTLDASGQQQSNPGANRGANCQSRYYRLSLVFFICHI